MSHVPGGREADVALEMTIHDVEVDSVADDYYYLVTLSTSRGALTLRYYHTPGARRGVVLAGGARGDWEGPDGGRLYPRLCEALGSVGVAAAHVCYRRPGVLEECVLDVLAALHFLEGLGAEASAVVGHSFGAAVALQAAAHAENVRAVVALATGPHAAGATRELPPDCAALFVHGLADAVNSVACARFAFGQAREPKRLFLVRGAGHGLDEATDEVAGEVHAWVVGHLCDAPRDWRPTGFVA